MSLVPLSSEDLSPLERAARRREGKVRAEALHSKSVIDYKYRRATGQVPLDNLIEINKRGK